MSQKQTHRLRVIAGSSRGRRLAVPVGDHVRPTKDMVREAMFSALDARGAVVDATVLDLFAGSGALAIEALSRGAARAVFVERDRSALQAIRDNLATLEFAGVSRVIGSEVERFLSNGAPPEAPFDLVVLDPPYSATDDEILRFLETVTEGGWVADGAIVTVERPVRHPIGGRFEGRKSFERAFGDTLLTF